MYLFSLQNGDRNGDPPAAHRRHRAGNETRGRDGRRRAGGSGITVPFPRAFPSLSHSNVPHFNCTFIVFEQVFYIVCFYLQVPNYYALRRLNLRLPYSYLALLFTCMMLQRYLYSPLVQLLE